MYLQVDLCLSSQPSLALPNSIDYQAAEWEEGDLSFMSPKFKCYYFNAIAACPCFI